MHNNQYQLSLCKHQGKVFGCHFSNYRYKSYGIFLLYFMHTFCEWIFKKSFLSFNHLFCFSVLITWHLFDILSNLREILQTVSQVFNVSLMNKWWKWHVLYVYLFLLSLIGIELILLKVRRKGCISFENGPFGYIWVKIRPLEILFLRELWT